VIELAIIFAFVIVAASLVFSFASKIHQRGIDHEQRKLELQARIAEAEAGQGGQTNAALEKRVRVLERLATDRSGMASASLADEIESLRGGSAALTDGREKELQQ